MPQQIAKVELCMLYVSLVLANYVNPWPKTGHLHYIYICMDKGLLQTAQLSKLLQVKKKKLVCQNLSLDKYNMLQSRKDWQGRHCAIKMQCSDVCSNACKVSSQCVSAHLPSQTSTPA